MATFRVGQRVRIIGATNKEWIGREATFVRYEFLARGSRPSYNNRGPVRVDCDCVIRPDADDVDHPVRSWMIEPLQPERNRVVAWEDCPFDPRKIAELV